MSNTPVLNTPVLWINAYLQDKLQNLGFQTMPFFPSVPSTIVDLTELFPASGVMATYDRMIRMRRSPFPHIKCEQLLYYFYATAENSVLNMVQITEQTLRLMDREDETAQELNEWCENHGPIVVDGQTLNYSFRFHSLKVFQLQETRDVINFATARTYAGNKMIIYYDYTLL